MRWGGVIKAETRNVNIKLKIGDYRKDREIKKAGKKIRKIIC